MEKGEGGVMVRYALARRRTSYRTERLLHLEDGLRWGKMWRGHEMSKKTKSAAAKISSVLASRIPIMYQMPDLWVTVHRMGGNVERTKAGAFVCGGMTMFEVGSTRHIEAVDQRGAVREVGKSFHLYAREGDEITFRRLAPPRTDFTAAEIKKARRSKTVTVVNQGEHDGGSFDFGEEYTNGSLAKVLASLTAIRASIPAAYRAKARCGIDSEGGYEGSHHARIEVSYERPETDDEVVARLTDEETDDAIKERGERAKLAALQKKYKAPAGADKP